MVDLNKFEALAKEIVETSAKEDMAAWLEKYRSNEQIFINFKSIVGQFKMESTDVHFNTTRDNKDSSSIRYSFAA